ncbi:17716_t:CDS:2 [Funneliformis caledonium]|uniref:17716_t:CDS:1 n=1 Tax=Funneliformis caledonium TaxID=1117310 RepID=A0A9N9DRC6_9GLOM|nr:17716_t:CDS:2 [Funneliformis caledonium]
MNTAQQTNGKVAIVTGASSGIGRGKYDIYDEMNFFIYMFRYINNISENYLAIAIRLVKEGAKVVIADVSEDAGKMLANELNTNKSEKIAIFHKTDVSKWKELISLFDKTKETFGKIDVGLDKIVINNAGIVGQLYGMLDDSLEGTKLAFQYMKQNDPQGGVVINTSSVAAFHPTFNVAVYAAAKAGVVNLTRSMAQISQLFGITVNAVCPSVTESGLTSHSIGILPENWWSSVNFVVDACFKCIYDPKTNGTIFTVWYEGIKEESFENYHPVFQAMLQGQRQSYLKSLENK